MTSMEPKESILSIFVFKGSERYASERLGTLRNIARPARTAPPMGRLLYWKCKTSVDECGKAE